MHKKFEFEYEELDAKEGLGSEDLILLNAAFNKARSSEPKASLASNSSYSNSYFLSMLFILSN